MRPIPAAMKAKLLHRFKAKSTDSVPNIRLTATQTSVNTLLSEPIREDIEPEYGDVAFRQMAGEDTLSLAYAISVEDGIAKIYQRKLPANFDYQWTQEWVLGEASDVAIEFDGEWKLDATKEWYYLETEPLPYIFFIRENNLYVQLWRDESTLILLAEGVTQVSVCKGWKNSVDQEQDQGLIVGYIRNGTAYYRAYCQQADRTKAWESEHPVSNLGTGCSTLSVLRTNDFRIGFLAQNGNDMLLTLTHRTYAGMSVKPETVYVSSTAGFSLESVKSKFGFHSDCAEVSISQPFFLYDNATNPAPEISITSAEKIVGEGFTATGCKLLLTHALTGTPDPTFKANVKANNTVVSDIIYHGEEQALVITFAQSIGRQIAISIVLPSTRYLTYNRTQGQFWFFPAMTVSLPEETQKYYGYDSATAGVSIATAAFELEEISRYYGQTSEAVAVTISTAGFVLEAVGVLPI